MIDPSPEEIAAIEAASPIAGEYLESIGKSDLAKMDESEWLTFLEVVITAYQDSILQGRANAPTA